MGFSFLLAGWFTIASAATDEGRFTYLVEQRSNNVHLSLVLNKPLKHVEGGMVNLEVKAMCMPQEQYENGQMVMHYLCSATKVSEIVCAEHNSFVDGGVRYC